MEKKTKQRSLAVVVLAAGDGKRMRSRHPKVLHEVGGKTLVMHVLDVASAVRPQRSIVVIGKGADRVRSAVEGRADCVVQEPRLGTGHAVAQAASALTRFAGDVIVLCGDVPLLRPATLRKLLAKHRRSGALASVLSMTAEDPTGYGRIVRGKSLEIIEHADADPEQRVIDEVNTGTYCFDAKFLFDSLGKLGRGNRQREYYLTDLIAMAAERGKAVCERVGDSTEGLGVNSRRDLAAAELALRTRIIESWMDRGVTFLDPSSTHVDADVRLAPDCTIGPGAVLLGRTRVGTGTRVEGSCWLRNTDVGNDVVVRWGVVADSARIARGAKVGPYSHLRPDADLGEDVHIGNFVEVKNATIGARSKANHLTYLGDARIGRDANIGAGTITCNYDGFHKHKTVIGDRVQIGSDTQLVAPVNLAADSYVAAGSTVNRDVPAWALAMNDKRQLIRLKWVKGFRARVSGTAGPRQRKGKS